MKKIKYFFFKKKIWLTFLKLMFFRFCCQLTTMFWAVTNYMLYTYNNESDKKNLIDNFFDGVKEKTFLYIILGNKKKLRYIYKYFTIS